MEGFGIDYYLVPVFHIVSQKQSIFRVRLQRFLVIRPDPMPICVASISTAPAAAGISILVHFTAWEAPDFLTRAPTRRTTATVSPHFITQISSLSSSGNAANYRDPSLLIVLYSNQMTSDSELDWRMLRREIISDLRSSLELGNSEPSTIRKDITQAIERENLKTKTGKRDGERERRGRRERE